LAQYNNFIFIGMTLEDIWLLDAVIPFKNRIVAENDRGVVMWIIWLERNRICFQNKGVRSVKIIGMHILSLVTYWYQQGLKAANDELMLLLPPNVNNLNFQVGSIMRIQEEEITKVHDPWFGREISEV
jgi:hypothetical protein